MKRIATRRQWIQYNNVEANLDNRLHKVVMVPVLKTPVGELVASQLVKTGRTWGFLNGRLVAQQ
jgi:hypothetical protein